MNKHEENIKKFAMFRDYDTRWGDINRTELKILYLSMFRFSKDFLVRNSDLVNEDTAGYLTLWCINLEVEEVSSEHAYISMLYLIDM